MQSRPAATKKVTAGSEALCVASNNADMSLPHKNSFRNTLSLTSSTKIEEMIFESIRLLLVNRTGLRTVLARNINIPVWAEVSFGRCL